MRYLIIIVSLLSGISFTQTDSSFSNCAEKSAELPPNAEWNAEEVKEELQNRLNELENVNTFVKGKLDNEEVEVKLQFIPYASVARLEFIKPDELADDFIVVDKESIFVYHFLTHEVETYKVQDFSVWGSLISNPKEEKDVNYLRLDLRNVYDPTNVFILSKTDNIYKICIDLSNSFTGEVSDVDYVIANYSQNGDFAWLPKEAKFYTAERKLFASASTEFAKVDENGVPIDDPDLSPDDVTYIPSDVEYR